MVRLARPILSDRPPMKALKAPIAFGDDQQVQEVLERHVVVGQQQRRDRPLHVVEVVEHDRRQHDDGQVARAGATCSGSGRAVAFRRRCQALAAGPVCSPLSSSSSEPLSRRTPPHRC